MQRLVWLSVLVIGVIGLGVGSAQAQPPRAARAPAAPLDLVGYLEWTYAESDDTPAPTLVLPERGLPSFGSVRAPIWVAWQPGDPEVVIYLPTEGGESVCPPEPICVRATLSYRRADRTEDHRSPVLTFPPTLPGPVPQPGPGPWATGQPGDPVTLRDPGDGTLRWVVSGAGVPPRPRAATGIRGTLEWDVVSPAAPHPAIRLPEATAPWWGFAGARVYSSWQAGDPEAVIYLPPPACRWGPLRSCASVCPAPISCFVGLAEYRWVGPDPAQNPTILRFPDGVPWPAGGPGDPVDLVDPGDGTVRWVLPTARSRP